MSPSLPAVELRGPLEPRPGLRLVVFDFDGTLSWLRHGWPHMMGHVFQQHLPPAWQQRPRTEVEEHLLDEILALNGQPSIFQCRRYVELCRAAGGPELEAEALRVAFQAELDAAITKRLASLRSGQSAAQEYTIHGVPEFLEHVCARGLTPAILSTTVQERVEEEAKLLGFGHYFGPHIYGGTGDPLKFSKRAVFERLLAEEQIQGAQLLSFGDGPVELRETKELGGIAIGVCSDEANNGSGVCDARKRRQLFEVGADAVIPDYRGAAALLDALLGH